MHFSSRYQCGNFQERLLDSSNGFSLHGGGIRISLQGGLIGSELPSVAKGGESVLLTPMGKFARAVAAIVGCWPTLGTFVSSLYQQFSATAELSFLAIQDESGKGSGMRIWGLRQKLATGLELDSAGEIPSGTRSSTKVNADALPSFLIVGPPRTGSSWLHETLENRANLPSPTKETRFFDSHFHRGLAWYRHSFPTLVPGRPTGEVAPTYFSSPEARERIARTLPNVKIIFTFREPIQRVLSLYRVKVAYGMLPWSFEDALDRDPELLESGKYATHLKAWQELFPPEQLLVTLYDDLRHSPQAYLEKLSDFLGIPRITLTEAELKHVHSSERMTEPRSYIMTRTALAIADWCKARKLDKVVAAVRNSKSMRLFIGGGSPFVEMSPEARERTTQAFRPEIDELESMLGRDLSAWRANFAHVPAHKSLLSRSAGVAARAVNTVGER